MPTSSALCAPKSERSTKSLTGYVSSQLPYTESQSGEHCCCDAGFEDRALLQVAMPIRHREPAQTMRPLLDPHVADRPLALLLTFALLHGCSGDVGSNTSPSSSSNTTMAATAPPSVVGDSTGVVTGVGVNPTVVAPSEESTLPAPPPDSTAPVTTAAPVTFAPAPGVYRRLTNAAFANSLRDLLHGPIEIGPLEPDSWAVGGLPTVGAAEVSVSELGVEQYQNAVEGAVALAFADLSRRDAILGCLPQGLADTACFETFVETFGRKAFRQPLSAAQVTRYVNLVTDVAATLGDAVEGMKAAVTAFLLSPNFLYRLERGQPDPNLAYWRYTSHELASRLAYFLTNSTPDAELLELADNDELTTTDVIRDQAERLLATPAGRESVENFAKELFQLRLVAARAKDPALYPEYDAALQQAMVQEVSAMFSSVVFDQNASALELFTTRTTTVTKQLAALYGIDATAGQDEDALVEVTLPEERAGLLGTGGILSIYGSQKEGSPTLRGRFIREVLLCQSIPSPPADVSTTFEDPPAGQVLTKREKLTRHQADPACSPCHALMDPLGLTLESYDAIGRYRTTDQGKAIDLSGNLDGAEFSGGVELGQLIAAKPETAKCMVRNLYRYGTGHVESTHESSVLAALNENFTASGFNLRDLMLQIVTSDGFRYVAPPTQ